MTGAGATKQIIVGITGASGAAYARRLIQCLAEGGATVHVITSPHGQRLLNDELGIRKITANSMGVEAAERFLLHPYRDIGDVLASGSFRTDGMIVCPCSSNTLAAIATGVADNLLARAAAVTLKELRRLIVVPREMPMNRVDLLNALRVSEAAGVICPAAPGFYMMPQSVDDLVDFVVGKLLDLVGVPHELNTRWATQRAAARRASKRQDAGASERQDNEMSRRRNLKSTRRRRA